VNLFPFISSSSGYISPCVDSLSTWSSFRGEGQLRTPWCDSNSACLACRCTI